MLVLVVIMMMTALMYLLAESKVCICFATVENMFSIPSLILQICCIAV